jgi:hypothetical protein
MERRRFTREFKIEAVKLVRERGVSVRQAARDLNVRQGPADTLVARKLHWSCTVVARCRGTLSEGKKATFCP